MSLVDQVVRSHLERENRLPSRKSKAREVERGDRINKLPLEDFHNLPVEDQTFAEELWTARVLEANMRIERERQTRLVRELELSDD